MGLAALGCDPDRVTTTAEFALGTLGFSPDGGLYVYVQADGAIDDGEACQIQGDFQAVPITTTNGTESNAICFPQEDIADNSYGWGLVFGKGNASVGASCAASVQLYTTANGGQLDDAATAIHIHGVQLTTARSATAGLAPVAVTWPAVDLIA